MHDDLIAYARDLGGLIESSPLALDDALFNAHALRLYTLQRARVPAYARLCHALLSPAATPANWREIPLVPTAAFKEFDITSLAGPDRARVFHSSGTTAHQPARHYHDPHSLQLYESSARAWFRPHLLAHSPAQLISLTPHPQHAPHSSLAHMLDTVARDATTAPPVFLGQTSPDGSWTLDPAAVAERLKALFKQPQPLLLTGTAFGFVHLLDHLAARALTLTLPAGSCVMETGGYKGRSRTIPKSELHALLSQHLRLPQSHIVTEYGMCELSSQAYDHTASQPSPPSHLRLFRFPPWARARVLDPETGRDAEPGTPGILTVLDLANVASVLAVQTQDLAIAHGSAFELVGRDATAEPRGCSLRHL